MRRIVTKNWKVIAYIIGYVVLIVAELDTLNTVYVGVGMAWLFVKFVKGLLTGGLTFKNTAHHGHFSDHDDRSPQPFGRDYGTLNANDATVIYGANCP